MHPHPLENDFDNHGWYQVFASPPPPTSNNRYCKLLGPLLPVSLRSPTISEELEVGRRALEVSRRTRIPDPV